MLCADVRVVWLLLEEKRKSGPGYSSLSLRLCLCPVLPTKVNQSVPTVRRETRAANYSGSRCWSCCCFGGGSLDDASSYMRTPRVCRGSFWAQMLCRIFHRRTVCWSNESGHVLAGLTCRQMLCCRCDIWTAFHLKEETQVEHMCKDSRIKYLYECEHVPAGARDERIVCHKSYIDIPGCESGHASNRLASRRRLCHNEDTFWPFCPKCCDVFVDDGPGSMTLNIVCHNLHKHDCLSLNTDLIHSDLCSSHSLHQMMIQQLNSVVKAVPSVPEETWCHSSEIQNFRQTLTCWWYPSELVISCDSFFFWTVRSSGSSWTSSHVKTGDMGRGGRVRRLSYLRFVMRKARGMTPSRRSDAASVGVDGWSNVLLRRLEKWD